MEPIESLESDSQDPEDDRESQNSKNPKLSTLERFPVERNNLLYKYYLFTTYISDYDV